MAEEGKNPQSPRTSVDVSTTGVKVDLSEGHASAIGTQLTTLFSPVVEGAGLIGDYIRFFRQAAAIRAMKRVQEIANRENLKLKTVPPKILIPWVEGVSLEETDSPLINWWAELLTSAATTNQHRPYLIDLMTKIGDKEAQLLEELWGKYSESVKSKKLPVVHAIAPYVKGFIEGRVNKKFKTETTVDALQLYHYLISVGDELCTLADERGIGVNLAVRSEDERKFLASRLVIAGATLDVCEALKLIEVHHESIVGFRGHSVAIEFSLFHFSQLGVEFMEACKPMR